MHHDIGEIIELIYAAALHAELWPRALEKIAAATGARGTVIVPFDPARTALTISSPSLDEANAEYRAGWWRHDTRVARARELALPPGIVTTDAAYFPEEVKRADPFFQDFLARHGLGDHAAFLARDPAGGILSITAQRDLRRGAFEASEIESFERLTPHLARAFTIGVAIAEARQRTCELEAALERLGCGVILLDRAGRAIHVSEAARALLGPGLQIGPDRRPRAGLPDERARLDRLVASALSDGDPGDLSPILLRRGADRSALSVEAVPIGRSEPLLGVAGGTDARVFLVLRDIFAERGSVLPLLGQLGLTPAEARSAEQIGRGRSAREAADALGIAEGTVRVNLKAAFAKLGLSRQSELAILVARLEQLASRRVTPPG